MKAPPVLIAAFAAACAASAASNDAPFHFVDVAAEAGVTAPTWCGGEDKPHILESGGTGLALFDLLDELFDATELREIDRTPPRSPIPDPSVLLPCLGDAPEGRPGPVPRWDRSGPESYPGGSELRSVILVNGQRPSRWCRPVRGGRNGDGVQADRVGQGAAGG